MIGPTSARFTATGALTEGRFGLYRWDMPAGGAGATPHFHKTFSESFYVLDGNVGLYNGDQWMDAAPGDFIYVPQGGIHGFKPDENAPSSMLFLFAPGAPRESYFEELAEIVASGRELSKEEWVEFWARHDQFAV
jgi:quercetin dioxygenase-like cupin family protein